MNNYPLLIAEIANFHGGNTKHIFTIIEKLKDVAYPSKALKFQPFHFDQIALPDYDWYPVYKKLFIKEAEWRAIIKDAKNQVGEVWLDLFDVYGVKILKENLKYISGVKLQASVLNNFEVFDALAEKKLRENQLILNISGFEVSEIRKVINRFKTLQPESMILQIGYQRYPTEIEDTALNKIQVLQKEFPGLPICFADHASAESSFAQRIPLIAASMGCAFLEKHVCLDRKKAEYDHYSALELNEFRNLAEDLINLKNAFSSQFISKNESNYYKESIQIPVMKQDLPTGTLVGQKDLVYRRTAQKGLTFPELSQLQKNGQLIANTVKESAALRDKDFRPARIACIVACRMKSSRLKQKAILPIAGVPSVERCLHNCLSIPSAGLVILATSTMEEDAILKDYTLNGEVKFWRGDPDDVIMRYLGACAEFGIDVVIRVTADCPVVSPEIAEILLASHFSSGADYSSPKQCAVGSGVEIYNVEALQRVIQLLGKAEYSEYMTCYMKNNADIFKINVVELPPEFVRDYRLTLDCPEDLKMFERLFERLGENQLDPTLKNVIEIMDQNPSIATTNEHLTLSYCTDQELIEKLNRVTRIRPI